MTRLRLLTLTLAVALLGAAVPAQASFHEIKVREIYAGTTGDVNRDFIELQMYSPGQNLVNGISVDTYSADAVTTTNHTFGANLGNGADQSTILLASAAAQTQFGVVSDNSQVLSPDELDAAGGAVCWDQVGMTVTHIDCVAWGSFPAVEAGQLSAGPREPAIPPDSSIVRRIDLGCPTALDVADDSNDSNADFAPGAPTPRANTQPPVDFPCVTGGGGGGGTSTAPGNPLSPINPAGNVRKRKCKKKSASAAAVTAKKKCKKR